MTLIAGDALVKEFRVHTGLTRTRALRAVDNVSLSVGEGQTVAVVGESGSGKSTLGRMLLGLIEPTSGGVSYRGKRLGAMEDHERDAFRREVQAVFQDTSNSLNPRRTIADSVMAPLTHHRGLSERLARDEAAYLLHRVGLQPLVYLDRFPHQLSGGQRQRVGLARAIASKPRFIVADEPVSALDVSVRAQVLRLLITLRDEAGLACLFITHDLAVVKAVASHVMVMYLGAIVEQGTVEQVFAGPRHPYTRVLLASTPVPDPGRLAERPALQGEIPSALAVPSGCRFRTRCPLASAECAAEPPAQVFEAGHASRCHFAHTLTHGAWASASRNTFA